MNMVVYDDNAHESIGTDLYTGYSLPQREHDFQ